MVNKAKEAETLQENLKYVIKDVKDAYVTTLDEHLNYEKQLEVKRYVYYFNPHYETFFTFIYVRESIKIGSPKMFFFKFSNSNEINLHFNF